MADLREHGHRLDDLLSSSSRKDSDVKILFDVIVEIETGKALFLILEPIRSDL